MARISVAAIIAALVGLLVPLSGAGVQDPIADWPVLAVPTPAGMKLLRVRDPGAAVSDVEPFEPALRGAAGASNLALDEQATNRLIVRTDNAAELIDAARRAGVMLEPVAAAPGFYLLHADNIEHAAGLARALRLEGYAADVTLDLQSPIVLRDPPSDPLFSQQWHLRNAQNPVVDANVLPAWDLGYTGAGVVIGVVEGGWQVNHPDLAENYLPEASQPAASPSPHATAVAGVAAAAGFNEQGGVGVAFESYLADLRFGTGSQIATAMTYRNDLNHVKSNSWGPPDNARIHYMTSLERAALEEAVQTGRGGLGEIFVWAAGNGGLNDRVDYDPYASSRMTIAVGAIGDQGVRSSFNERGASMLIVAPSSGNTRGITTTTRDGYTSTFGGTSAACPLAAGVVALMLQANPALTWRDVQHVLINSACPCDAEDPEWILNAAGHAVNYNYGFGAIDAAAAVELAADWEPVGPEQVLGSGEIAVNTWIGDNDPAGVEVRHFQLHNARVESVEVVLSVQTPYVGDLEIVLTSPQGTASVLAETRGDPQDNLVNYVFTSVRSWDEPAAGTWTVRVADRKTGDRAFWQRCELRIYGGDLSTGLPGDLNCDGAVDEDDIDPFVLALTEPHAYATASTACDIRLGDLNGDGFVDNEDIDPFVAVLTQ